MYIDTYIKFNFSISEIYIYLLKLALYIYAFMLYIHPLLGFFHRSIFLSLFLTVYLSSKLSLILGSSLSVSSLSNLTDVYKEFWIIVSLFSPSQGRTQGYLKGGGGWCKEGVLSEKAYSAGLNFYNL